MKRQIPGFIYPLGKPYEARSFTLAEWREVIAKGTGRRVENGETFVHDGARIIAEIYARVA